MGVIEQVLERFPDVNLDAWRLRLAQHGIAPDVAEAAINLIFADVASGRTVADAGELGTLVLAQARGIVLDQHKASGKVVTDRIQAAAQWIHKEAIGDAYAVADEAAEVVAEWKREADICLRWAQSSEARCERLLDNRDATALERKLFLEAPPWARLWWAFRGRLGPK